jgi:hypothetical protein
MMWRSLLFSGFSAAAARASQVSVRGFGKKIEEALWRCRLARSFDFHRECRRLQPVSAPISGPREKNGPANESDRHFGAMLGPKAANGLLDLPPERRWNVDTVQKTTAGLRSAPAGVRPRPQNVTPAPTHGVEPRWRLRAVASERIHEDGNDEREPEPNRVE